MPMTPESISAGRTPPSKQGSGGRQVPVTKTSAEIQSELDAEAEAEAKRRRIQVSPLVSVADCPASDQGWKRRIQEADKCREHAISVDAKR